MQRNEIILLLLGAAGAGKNTTADCIEKLIRAKQWAFADKLKEVAKELTWDGEKDEKGRRFLQALGQVAREYNQDVWVNFVIEEIKHDYENVKVHVITDCRFPNEVQKVKEAFDDVVTIRIVGRKDDLGKNANDVSEHSLDDFIPNFIIENTGTIAELENKLIDLLQNKMGLM